MLILLGLLIIYCNLKSTNEGTIAIGHRGITQRGARTVSRCQMVSSAQPKRFFCYAAYILQQLQN